MKTGIRNSFFILAVLTLAVSLIMCQKENEIFKTPPDVNPIDTTTPNPLAWTQAEIDLIMSQPGDSAMRIFLTTNYSDSMLLRAQSINVITDTFDTVFVRLMDRLKSTVIQSGSGVGIAAPQIGISRNMYWLKRLDKTGNPWEVFLNPVITAWSHDSINFIGDGCLSIPNVTGTTRRAKVITIEYDSPDGQHHVEAVDGWNAYGDFTAIIFQHETDHLNGILFVDRKVN
ncbi:MAG: peptide deformylase [Bacteroidetes bacterium]|nr:peptide deformylase [Bacteroidota bacterium]MBU1719543.1 peptide deformylase [Bacteroidota bacterium]